MNTPTTTPKNIVLIGFMGCGKSTVGRELHKNLGYQLVDMDHIIEERAGKPITKIFQQDGETAFRDQESSLLRELCQPGNPRRIISTGGGIIGRHENRELLRNLGYVVWLNAPRDTIIKRTLKHKTRPLLNTSDAADQITRLMAERHPLYAETAHLEVDTTGLSSYEVASGLLDCARYYFNNPE
ncbi:MAG: shikimate kinase [Verrucomicrobiales bacterium]|nr:shikimate kinase [Verrucomicrobiota bacterium JB025]